MRRGALKFFTRAWAEAELAEDERRAADARYSKHIEELGERLPPAVARLAEVAGFSAHRDELRELLDVDRAET